MNLPKPHLFRNPITIETRYSEERMTAPCGHEFSASGELMRAVIGAAFFSAGTHIVGNQHVEIFAQGIADGLGSCLSMTLKVGTDAQSIYSTVSFTLDEQMARKLIEAMTGQIELIKLNTESAGGG